MEKPSNKLTGLLFRNLLPKDIIPFYVIFALLAKNIILVGFIINKDHYSSSLKSAVKMLLTTYHFRAVYYLGFTLLVTWLLFLFKNRTRFYVSIFVNFLFSALFLIDLWYVRGFNTLPTLHTLQAGGNMSDSLSGFFALVSWKDLIFIIDIPVLIALGVIKRNYYRNIPRNIVFSMGMLILSLTSIFCIAPAVNSISAKPIPMNWIFYRFDATNTIDNISPLGYEVYSSVLYFSEKRNIKLDTAERNRIAKWYQDKKENLPDNEYKGMFKGKNLLVIQVESLEKFVINQKINGQEITPELNKLVKNSMFFTNIHEQVGGGNSSDADLMTNASVYPIQLGTTFFSNPFTHYNSFPKMLKKNGYFTTAIHPDNGAFWNWMPALKSMGFNKCYDSSYYKTTERINMGISDGTYFDQIEPIIAKEKQPFYTFLVTLSSHTPFELADKYRELKLSEELDKSKLGGYLQCIHYTDKQLGRLLDKLQKDGILDNTVVAIYGDHEGIHKYFPKDIGMLSEQESWWKDNGKRIPLIIYNKNLKGKEINVNGGQVDTMPTLAYLMGIDESSYINTAMGRNLLKTNKDFAVLRNSTVVGNVDEKDKAHAVEGLEISDKIIRGDYFKK